MVSNNLVGKRVKRQTPSTYYSTATNNNKEEEQERPRIIKITECLSKPCAVYYTDTLSESVLIICENPQHHKVLEKVGGEIANLNLNQTSQQIQSPGDDVLR